MRYLLFFIWFSATPAMAQILRQDTLRTDYKAQIMLLKVSEGDKKIVQRILPLKSQQWQNDSILRLKDPVTARNLLHKAAYLAASFDEVIQKDSMLEARLFLGPYLHWVNIKPADPLANRWLRAAGMPRSFRAGAPIQADVLARAQQRILEQGENNGYPFASIWLDSIRIDSTGGANALLRVYTGQYFTYNKLKINGDVKLPNRMLSRFLEIGQGDAFSRSQILKLRDRLKTLPYIDQYANPTVTFSGENATVNVWLKKKKAGRFDFIIGLLPQPDNSTGGSNLTLTGALNATFFNALGQGERMALEIERLRPETQKLDLQAGIPYIAGSPFGAEGRLSIFRRDSTWVDAMGNFGVLYLLSGTDKISFFVENRSSFLQRIDSTRIITTRQLPTNLDFRQNGLGVELEFNRLDYRYNPRKGILLQSKLFGGRHTIQKNSQLEQLKDPKEVGFDFGTLYDSLRLKTVRFRPEAKIEGFIPISGQVTCLLRARGGGIFTKDPVTQNEQYRLGGNKLLRGFNEESLFATRWAVATAEIRLITGQNSFLSVFADGGYIENITRQTRIFQRPLGLGAGLNFETPSGVFGIGAAVGRANPGEGLDLRATKIHIGYLSIF